MKVPLGDVQGPTPLIPMALAILSLALGDVGRGVTHVLPLFNGRNLVYENEDI